MIFQNISEQAALKIVLIFLLALQHMNARTIGNQSSHISIHNKSMLIRNNDEACNDSVRLLNAKQIIKQLSTMLQNELKNLYKHESNDEKKHRKGIQMNLLIKLKNLKSNCPNIKVDYHILNE